MPFALDNFYKLAPEKQERIRFAALEEFALKGYENANTNHIAEAAGISVGSLFNYFANKEAIFLYLIDLGSKMIEESVSQVFDDESLSCRDKLEKLLRVVLKTTREQPLLIRLYHETSAIGNQNFLQKITFNLESYTARAYENLLYEGQKSGEIRDNLDIRMATFNLDNIVRALQFSYSIEYEKERYYIYVAPHMDSPLYDERVISACMDQITHAFFVQ